MGDTKSSDALRLKLEGFRAKMILRFGEKKCRLAFRLIIASAVALLLLILAFFLIRISTIEVTGDVTMFNESEVISAAEIDIGDGLFWKNSWWKKKNIEKNMPIAQNVKVKKSIFGKVTIHIELLSVDYYAKIGEKYYALDSSLRVLDSNDSSAKYASYGAVKVVLPEVREPVVGEKLVFYDTVKETDTEKETLYEVRDKSFYSYTVKFLESLLESGFHDDANGVILTEKFDITLIYANKYRVRFGNSSDLDVKFRVFYEILAEGSTQYSDKVSVDLSNPTSATARTELTLDFSEFGD